MGRAKVGAVGMALLLGIGAGDESATPAEAPRTDVKTTRRLRIRAVDACGSAARRRRNVLGEYRRGSHVRQAEGLGDLAVGHLAVVDVEPREQVRIAPHRRATRHPR